MSKKNEKIDTDFWVGLEALFLGLFDFCDANRNRSASDTLKVPLGLRVVYVDGR